jgi:hypothetical protein
MGLSSGLMRVLIITINPPQSSQRSCGRGLVFGNHRPESNFSIQWINDFGQAHFKIT